MTSEASPPSVTAQSVYAELHADEGDAGGALTRVPLAEFCANEGAQSPVHLVAVNLSNAIIGAGIVGALAHQPGCKVAVLSNLMKFFSVLE